MTEDRFKDLEVRLRKVEDFILGQLHILLELSQSLKNRVDGLEEHNIEFTAILHTTCDVKNKDITAAKKEAMSYADGIHRQTWVVISILVSSFIGAVVYFNAQVTDRALASNRNATHIEGVMRTLDRIDSKLDKLGDNVQDSNKDGTK